MVNHEELLKLIAGGESETVELKASFDKEVVETAGAFANTRGGMILIGVSDSKKSSGFKPEKRRLKIGRIRFLSVPILASFRRLKPLK